MDHFELEHSDYIVYVDEGYPVFVLSFCVFEKKHYSHLEKKLHRNHDGEVTGYGFHLYPFHFNLTQTG